MWSAAFFDLETPCLETLLKMLNTLQFAESSPFINAGEINENTRNLTEGKINSDDTEAIKYVL